MALQGIAHKNLTDPQLHEMKGAAAALEGQVPFADGEGGTVFREITFEDIEIAAAEGSEHEAPVITDPISINDDAMGATTTQILTDSGTFPQVNKNIKEVAEAYKSIRTAYLSLKADHAVLIGKYNQIVEALKDLGIIEEEE